jgi:4-phytase/acid phosphatase
MNVRFRTRCAAVLLGVLFGTIISALPSGTRSHDRLVMTVILSRHGLRSPLVPISELDQYSVQSWPAWPVAPGVLSERGSAQLRTMGDFDRAFLARQGMLQGDSCSPAREAYVWTDTDERTIASGHALAAGMFPGCTVPVHRFPQGHADPLFHPDQHQVPPDIETAALAQVRSCAEANPERDALIRSLQNLLRGCASNQTCASARRPARSLLAAPMVIRPSTQDDVIRFDGPLPMASSFAEDFELEYMDGLPMGSVAWGHLPLAQLQRLISLHTDYIACLDATPALARLGASDLLAHIVSTLQQSVQQNPVPGALAPPDKTLVLLDGHDSNLVGVAALLGLHWKLDSRVNDTPPASQIMFQLWRAPQGGAYVRVLVQMPTLRQMRALSPLRLALPPAQQEVALPGCSAVQGCTWMQFQAIAKQAIDPRFVRNLDKETLISGR